MSRQLWFPLHISEIFVHARGGSDPFLGDMPCLYKIKCLMMLGSGSCREEEAEGFYHGLLSCRVSVPTTSL